MNKAAYCYQCSNEIGIRESEIVGRCSQIISVGQKRVKIKQDFRERSSLQFLTLSFSPSDWSMHDKNRSSFSNEMLEYV